MISVKDIHEKEFGTAQHGYKQEEVDDFLDELAQQMEGLIRENFSLKENIKQRGKTEEEVASLRDSLDVSDRNLEAVRTELKAVRSELDAANAKLEAAPEAGPRDDEYFEELKATLRDTMTNAQKRSEERIAEANTEAEHIIAAAKVQAEEMRVASEHIRCAAVDFRAKFLELVQEQVARVQCALPMEDAPIFEACEAESIAVEPESEAPVEEIATDAAPVVEETAE